MKLHIVILMLALFFAVTFCAGTNNSSSDDGWISLFNGESLEGWKVTEENSETITVEDGKIKIDGPRAHLYYDGEVENSDFTNFEFKAEILTRAQANSGVYFHTDYRASGWPETGYEVQVNNTHGDWRKTGSLYNVMDVKEVYAEDDEWFELYFKVEGDVVEVKINGTKILHYHEPGSPLRDPDDKVMSNRVLGSGTFALQGHDPNSVIFYRNIYVKPLP